MLNLQYYFIPISRLLGYGGSVKRGRNWKKQRCKLLCRPSKQSFAVKFVRKAFLQVFDVGLRELYYILFEVKGGREFSTKAVLALKFGWGKLSFLDVEFSMYACELEAFLYELLGGPFHTFKAFCVIFYFGSST